MDAFATRDVAAMVGLTAGQVRRYARAGVVAPARGARGEYRFAFRDLVLLRAASSLAAARISRRRILGVFAHLRVQLPRERALSGVNLAVHDGHIVATDGETTWDPETGQLLLVLNAPATPGETVSFADSTPSPAGAADADAWFARGEELESTSAESARDAYGRALAFFPGHADAHVNLGRLLHVEGRAAEAADHYRQALAIDGSHLTARFNLGVALEDLRAWDEAAACYERVLVQSEGFADAHYNLACLHERLGDRRAALRHFRIYRALADEARD